MIKKLQRKFILIVMGVVTIILLAIFLTMIISTYTNSAKVSMDILNQVMSTKPVLITAQPSGIGRDGMQPTVRGFSARQPVLIMNVDNTNTATIEMNQLHFLETSDAKYIGEVAMNNRSESGVLDSYDLRYLKKTSNQGTRLAFIDISQEKELMRIQIIIALSIGGAALLVFFVISIFLSRWAIRPVETAWEKQKQFVANASHELKTPLTVILSNADILQDEDVLEDEKDKTRMEHIHVEALRMKDLLEDMLVLAKHDNSNIRDTYETVDFSDIIKSSALVYEPIFYDSGKKLTYDIDENLLVQGDRAKLQQVTHILLDNAKKYSDNEGKIHISLKRDGGQSLLLTVSNTGEPIPQTELENIFLRFYRRNESRTSDGSFGLGLSIAQSIVSEHKGKIWAKSDGENHFYISLPLAV